MLDLDNIESDEYSRRLKLLDGLKSALRTQSLSFVERFIELDGLTRLLEFLLSMNTGTVENWFISLFKTRTHSEPWSIGYILGPRALV